MTVLLGAALLVAATGAGAHIPHDRVPLLQEGGDTLLLQARDEFYRSDDGGRSWRRETRGITCSKARGYGPQAHRAVAVAPDGARVFVACDGRLLATRPGAPTYHPQGPLPDPEIHALLPAPAGAPTGILLAQTGDGGLWRSADDGMSWNRVPGIAGSTALAWDAAGLFAASEAGMLHRSSDGGLSWTLLATLPGPARIGAIAPAMPGGGQATLLGTSDGIVRLYLPRDAAAPVDLPGSRALAGRDITSLLRSGTDRDTLFAATVRDGVYRSRDGGDTWEQVAARLQTSPQAAAFGDPDYTALAQTADGAVFLAGFNGLYRSADGGDSWARLDLTLGHVVALDAQRRKAGGYRLGLVPYAGGILLSEDRGRTWAFHQSGLDVRRTSFAFATSGDGSGTMFSGNRWFMGRVGDGETRWREQNLEPLYKNDPRIPQGTGTPTPVQIAPSPDFARDGTVFAGLYPLGVIRSQDGGKSFDLVMVGAGPSTSVAVSPGFARDGTVLATAGAALFRSRDRGDSWDRVHALEGATSLDMAMSPRFEADGAVALTSDRALHLSRDRGDSWTSLPPPPAGGAIEGALLLPEPDGGLRLLVQRNGAALSVGKVTGDTVAWHAARLPGPGGEFSRLTNFESFDLFVPAPDYMDSGTIYGGAGNRLLVSHDRGDSWTALPRFPVRYEAENGLSDIRPVPLTADPSWSLTRPPLPTGMSRREQVARAALQLVYWRRISTLTDSSLQTLRSRTEGATLRLDFVGRGVTVLGPVGRGRGRFAVTLDGRPVARIDQRARVTARQQALHTVTGLPRDFHRLEITVQGDGWVEIDAFEVTP